MVPVEGQPWTTDPFTLIRKGDKLYGRGACDMKGFDACVLAAVPAMVAADLKRPSTSASPPMRNPHGRRPRLIARLGQDWTRPSACIVGEPSRMKVVTGHKGYIRIDTHVRGHEVHSSQRYNGVSAVFVAARLISWMEDRDLRNKAEAEAHGGVPYFDPGWTMLHVGTMQGGTAHNITALDAHFVTGIRVVPGDDGEKYVREYEDFVRREIEPAMKAVHPDAGVTITWRVGGQPLVREEDGEAERIARRLTGDNGIQVVPYGAEAGLFQTAGISTHHLRPGASPQAHQPDEWIEIAELDRCDALHRRLPSRVAAAEGAVLGTGMPHLTLRLARGERVSGCIETEDADPQQNPPRRSGEGEKRGVRAQRWRAMIGPGCRHRHPG